MFLSGAIASLVGTAYANEDHWTKPASQSTVKGSDSMKTNITRLVPRAHLCWASRSPCSVIV